MLINGKETEIIGIVRFIDNLGRLSIPKEYRKSLGITRETPLGVLLTEFGEIVIKKINQGE